MFKIGPKEIDIYISKEYFRDIFKAINEVENLHKFINEQPVYPEWREGIQKTEIIRAIQGTLALEGSDIETEEIEKIATLKEPATSTKDKEAENALRAYEYIEQWSSNHKGEKIPEELIKQIHTILTRDIDYYLNKPGQYRNQVVEFGYPRQKSYLKDRFEVEEAMGRLVDFINKFENIESLEYATFPETKALLSHYFITFIHPFIDGNGRVARAIEALILHHYGRYEPYMFPINAKFYYKERKKYFELLRKIDTERNPHPFIIFALNGLHESLTEIKKHLMDKITGTLILDYAHQLRRTNKLLRRQTTLLENMFYLEPMEIGDFLRHPSIRAIYLKLSESTRKRDIANLEKYNLVKYIEEKRGDKKTHKLTVNWDALRFVTLRLDHTPYRPE